MTDLDLGAWRARCRIALQRAERRGVQRAEMHVDARDIRTLLDAAERLERVLALCDEADAPAQSHPGLVSTYEVRVAAALSEGKSDG